MANIELFDKVIEQIKAHPELWDQGSFARETECGTAYCVAGWTVALTSKVEPLLNHRLTWGYVDASGIHHDFGTQGALKLGLDMDQAEILFDPDRTLEQIIMIRDMLIEDPEVAAETLWDACNPPE